MARAALAWSTPALAKVAEVGTATINRFETGQGSPNKATIAAIQRAFEAAGIEFLDGDGVRLIEGAHQ